ncbi:hypothetical protein V1525DRAFT_423173 [Lipomyces kononenkoae]|uniref:Uncharacterized protein n=1 Tax=Lipomyces kononenkoae TaxID=34357 RepID=A0ACC3TET2_LIPKO
MYSQLRDPPSAPGDYPNSVHLTAPYAHPSHQHQPIHPDEEPKVGPFGLRRPYVNNLPSLHLLNRPMSPPPGLTSSVSPATSGPSSANNLLTPPTFDSGAAATSSTAPEAYSIAPSSSYPNNSSMSYWAAASSARNTDVVFVNVVAILTSVAVVDRVVTVRKLIILRSCGRCQQFGRALLPSRYAILSVAAGAVITSSVINITAATSSLDLYLRGVKFVYPFTLRLPIILHPLVTATTAPTPVSAVLLRHLSTMAISPAGESAARTRTTTIAYVAAFV